jgi:hypothetical protein
VQYVTAQIYISAGCAFAHAQQLHHLLDGACINSLYSGEIAHKSKQLLYILYARCTNIQIIDKINGIIYCRNIE